MDSFFSDDEDEDEDDGDVDHGGGGGNNSSGGEGGEDTNADAVGDEEKGDATKGSDNERHADMDRGADSVMMNFMHHSASALWQVHPLPHWSPRKVRPP